MVGKRAWTKVGKGDKNGTLKPSIARFQDASHKAVEDDRREQIKNRLIDGVEREALEHYRKSEDEVTSPFHSTRQKLIPCADQKSQEQESSQVLRAPKRIPQ
jgi:hypothetical protein